MTPEKQAEERIRELGFDPNADFTPTPAVVLAIRTGIRAEHERCVKVAEESPYIQFRDKETKEVYAKCDCPASIAKRIRESREAAKHTPEPIGTEWEYKRTAFNVRGGIEKELNEMGNKGWELVHVEKIPMAPGLGVYSSYSCWFKRRKGR